FSRLFFNEHFMEDYFGTLSIAAAYGSERYFWRDLFSIFYFAKNKKQVPPYSFFGGFAAVCAFRSK
ncbi:MAG: hypothetical protein P1U70_26810, partial [Saprospiraceae bacterium]|nr:hypothetical protein [Saprospiraceae bacterium]